MGQRVILYDDITGEASDDISTVEFSVQGFTYQIDLLPHHIQDLHLALEQFTSHGRLVERPKAKRQSRPKEAATPTSAGGETQREKTERLRRVREWAREHGFEVPQHGRIPEDAMHAYAQAHQEEAA